MACVFSIVMNVGYEGTGIQDVMLNVENDRTGAHEVVTNVKNVYVYLSRALPGDGR